MKKDLITEINRFNELMGRKTLLSEQAAVKFLNYLFKTKSDDAVELMVKNGIKNADEAADILRRIKNGDELTKEIAEKLLKDTGTMRLLANTLVDGTTLGVQFTNSIEKLIKDIVKDRKSYDELLEIFSKKLDEASVKADWPDGLADEMMESVRNKVDDAIGDMSSYTSTPRVLGKGARFAIQNSVRLHHLKIARLYRDFFKSNDTLKNEIVSLVKGYQEGGSQYSQAYAVKIGEKLNVLESKMNGLGMDIWDQIKVDVPRDLKNKLDNIDVTKRWKELRDIIQSDETIGKTVQDGWDKFKETLPFYFKKSIFPIRFKKVPLANLNKLSNFILTGQMQTTRELYERLVKAGALKGSALTYLRAVTPTLLIPTVMALGKTILGPTGKAIENSINSIGGFFDKDWDVNVTDWEPEVKDGKVNVSNTIKQNFKSLVGNESSFFQYQKSDFIPLVNSYVDDLVDWYFSIGYKDPSNPPKHATTINDLRYDLMLNSVKLSAPEKIHDFIWSDSTGVKLAGPNNKDYEIKLEGGKYMVYLPSGKINIKDY